MEWETNIPLIYGEKLSNYNFHKFFLVTPKLQHSFP